MTAISVHTGVSPNRRLLLTLPQNLPVGPGAVTVESLQAQAQAPASQQSALVRRLQPFCQQALAEGITTLTQDEVLALR
jgi:hypothetical protein